MANIDNFEVFKKLEPEFKKSINKYFVYSINEALIVDRNDNVYNIINNRKMKIDILCQQKVKNFAYAQYNNANVVVHHMLAITEEGNIYGWGCNSQNQVKKANNEDFYETIYLKLYANIFEWFGVKTSDKLCQYSQTIILNLFSNEWRQLGKMCEPYYRFKMIACGVAHCLVVTTDNNIMVWGNNLCGQIGTGQTTSFEDVNYIPVKKPHFKEYKPIPGAECACCMCSTGASALCCFSLSICSPWFILGGFIAMPIAAGVTCCVSNMFENTKKTSIHEDSDIKQIACGNYHNLVLFENGNLWGWGLNGDGQLGRSVCGIIKRPRPFFGNVEKVAAANNYTLVLCKDKTLWGMGDNFFAQLGNFDQMKYNNPIKFDIKFLDITTFDDISIGLTVDEEFYAWGLYKYEAAKQEETEEPEDNENEKDDEKEGQHKKKSNVKFRVIAYLIDQPKKVRCRSFNDFFSKLKSKTNVIVDVEKEEEFILNLPGDVPDDYFDELIDESELRIVEYVFQEGQSNSKEERGNKTYIFGDSNRMTMFDRSNINPGGNFHVSGTNFTGKS